MHMGRLNLTILLLLPVSNTLEPNGAATSRGPFQHRAGMLEAARRPQLTRHRAELDHTHVVQHPPLAHEERMRHVLQEAIVFVVAPSTIVKAMAVPMVVAVQRPKSLRSVRLVVGIVEGAVI